MENRASFLTLLASAALLILGLPPLGLWPLSWMAFVPIFLLLERNDTSRTSWFGISLLIGFFYFGYGIYWLWNYDFTIYTSALLCLIPCFAVLFFSFGYFRNSLKDSTFYYFLAPTLWIILMKIYSLTPLGNIAQEVPFYGPFSFFQIASVSGFKTHGALVLGLNAAIAAGIHKKTRRAFIACAVFILLLVSSYSLGSARLKERHPEEKIKAALIQHNLPAIQLWNISHSREIFETYRRLALEASKGKPDLIIFPLYSLPGDLLRHPDFFTDLARQADTPILIATYVPQVESNRDAGFFDMALLYSPQGTVSDIYQAIQPPPFRRIGETNIAEYKLLNTPAGRAGIFLCYENALERMGRKAVNLGADFFISLSNPGFFNQSFMPDYHWMQDRLRAVESGRYVLRVSPNGYSGLIDPLGRVIQKTSLDKEEILTLSFGTRQEKTFYHRNPDWVFWMASIFIAGLLIKRRRPV
ncbi:MAG: apolipoprotein N-acyltransferase [Candidatus Omnitrophica bacterium]|nr:apolipoprotein N-acyltransferase [Candidatus Omnitrophota bacterium]